MKTNSFSTRLNNRSFTMLFRSAIAATALLALAPVQAAFDIFVKLVPQSGSLTGDSLDKTYPGTQGWFEVSGFDFGIENVINLGSVSGGAGAGKASFQKLTITKSVDSVSPKIFKAVGSGTHFTSGTIAIRKAGASTGVPEAYLTFDFNLVFASSQKFAGTGGDDLPKETVTFEFGAAKITYFKQKGDGSLLKPGLTETWNVINNNDTFEINMN